VLQYCLYGPEDGQPVIDHHGTPGSRLAGPRFVDQIVRSGVRLLSLDRAGYGGSTRHPGRSVADVAEDVAVLADAQGWDRFVTIGGSGGAPHALACAVRLPDRVIRCAAIACPAPYAADEGDGPAGLGPDSFFVGMSPGEVEEEKAALRGEAAYRPLVERIGGEAMAKTEAGDPNILAGYELSESDQAEIQRYFAERPPGWLERARAMWLESHDGWIDDMIAITRPWGFDLAALAVPVALWYGLEDVLCPRGHSEWLLRYIPGVDGRQLAGGHLASEEAFAEILAWAAGSADVP
jgi:pimeloyl-ACP methyl ester carboxylesterase